MTKWKTKTKVCPDCGVRFYRWCPGAGAVAQDGTRYGSAYCRRCMNERTKAWHREPSGWLRRCEHCDEWFPTMNRQEYGGRPRPRFCSHRCRGLASRTYKENPAGSHLCRAPVPGGCPLPRGDNGKGSQPLCMAHDKRKQRGRPIDTPVNMKMSKGGRAGQARRRARLASRKGR